MKIVVFGANSPTAQLMIKKLSLIESIEIYGLIRSQSEKLFKHHGLTYLNYGIAKLLTIRQDISNADCWISFIGASDLLKARKVTTLYRDTANLIIRESQFSKPKRVIWISSGGVVENPNDGFIFKRILKPFFLKNMYLDMLEMEKRITESNLNYTIVRPPYLTNGKQEEDVRTIEFYFKDDKSLNRISLAHFLANEIVNPKWLKKIVAVSS